MGHVTILWAEEALAAAFAAAAVAVAFAVAAAFVASVAAAVRVVAPFVESAAGAFVLSAAASLDRRSFALAVDVPVPASAGAFGDPVPASDIACSVAAGISGPVSRSLCLEAQGVRAAEVPWRGPELEAEEHCSPHGQPADCHRCQDEEPAGWHGSPRERLELRHDWPEDDMAHPLLWRAPPHDPLMLRVSEWQRSPAFPD